MIYLLLLINIILVMILLYAFHLFRTHEINEIKHTLNHNYEKTIEAKQNQSEIAQSYEFVLQELLKTRENLGETKQSMKQMSHYIEEINKIMIHSKKRGNYGEIQLAYLLENYLGDYPELYHLQYHLNNGKISDAALHVPFTNKLLMIDAKFPLENYIHLLDDGNSSEYKQAFIKNVRKHIQDIKDKYINEETVNQAILFIPSEAIYAYICANCPELVNESYRKHVLIASPTTLLALAFNMVMNYQNEKRNENIEAIEKQIIKLYEDSIRLNERYEKVSKTTNTLLNQLQELGISIRKVNKVIDESYKQNSSN